MKRTLLVTALGALLIVGSGLSLVAVDAYAARPNIVTPQGGVTYKYKDAGLQFNVSAGWEIEADSSGVTFSKLESETSFVIASITTLDPAPPSVTFDMQFKAAWSGVASTAMKDSKDFKKIGEPSKGTQSDMPVISQGYTATQGGVQMIGVLALIKAAKPTLIFIYGTAKTSAEFNKDFGNLMDSIKKIE